MNNKFAKLFEIGEDQVLVKKSYDEETEECKLNIETLHSDAIISAILGFKSERARDKAFDAYSEEDARNFQREISKLNN